VIFILFFVSGVFN